MNKCILILVAATGVIVGCADNQLDDYPQTSPFPLQLMIDGDAGGDLPNAEDYRLEVAFAEYIGTLPNEPITIQYAITDVEGDMVDAVAIDKITYEVDIDDCVYERELAFTGDLNGAITISPDPDLGTVPGSFEIVFTLPGLESTAGGFAFEITGLDSRHEVVLGMPVKFKYAVLDMEIAGEWELLISDAEEFDKFKLVFASLNADLEALAFNDISGLVTVEFEHEEMKFVIELVGEEEVVSCENGVLETEVVKREIGIEADYSAEDGALELEGSHFILGDDGEIENELDFIVEATYHSGVAEGTMVVSMLKVVDEENFEAGEELFVSDDGVSFLLTKN